MKYLPKPNRVSEDPSTDAESGSLLTTVVKVLIRPLKNKKSKTLLNMALSLPVQMKNEYRKKN